MFTNDYFVVHVDGEHLHTADTEAGAREWADGQTGEVAVFRVTQTWDSLDLAAMNMTVTLTPVE